MEISLPLANCKKNFNTRIYQVFLFLKESVVEAQDSAHLFIQVQWFSPE